MQERAKRDGVSLTRSESDTLRRYARAARTPQALARRTRIVLLAAEGHAIANIANRLGTSKPTVRLWIRRFEESGIDAILRVARGPGRPSKLDPAVVAARLGASSRRRPSIRELAREFGVSVSSMWRTLQRVRAHH